MSKINKRLVRDRLANWESRGIPLTTLSTKQKDICIQLSSTVNERRIPSNLPEDDDQLVLPHKQLESSTGGSVVHEEFQKSAPPEKAETAQMFLSWYSDLEKDMEKEEEAPYRHYIEELQGYQDQCDGVLGEVTTALTYLAGLQKQYVSVSTKTNALHEACEHLLAEQTRLMNTAENISNKLSYYNELDKISSKLASPTLMVTNESFVPMLSRLDECILYLRNNPNYKESQMYLARLNQCLSRALSLIKSHVINILQSSTRQVQEKKDSTQLGDNAFTLFYGKFRANAPRVKALMEQLEIRLDKSPEYNQALVDCQQCYFSQRELLLGPSITSTINDLATKHVRDHCALMRSGCAFMVHVCEDEYQLYYNFFTRHSPLLDEMLERLCNNLYDVFRPLIIHVNHLETLAELCSIMKVEMLEEHAQANAQELSSFSNVCHQMLMDMQERLVYRTYIYIRSDILQYSAAQGDLAYPEKLEMMQSIAESIRAGETKGHTRTPSSSSLKGHSRSPSNASSTSQEVAELTEAGKNEMKSMTSTMPMSPADLHGMWYPTVRRTLVTLSKLYRCIDRTTFQGLSQEALQSCIQSLKTAKEGITKRKTLMDGQLFLIKHLLILREQIAPFQTDFSIRETSLDFSKLKDAAKGLIQNSSKMFTFNSNNSLLQFILEGTPHVMEHFVDSKKDVDVELKVTCEEFIHHMSDNFTEPLKTFLSRACVVINMKQEEGIRSVSLRQQPFATPEKLHDVVSETYKNIKSRLPTIHKSMQLYLANRDTETILFKPIKVNIQQAFQQLSQILTEDYTEEDIQIVANPSPEQINLLISTTMR
ncbi:conserved oligomeric Golgi complex subunit 3-like isoform X2 [Ostrea edulis]|uniref:conserved oligomeric Golgi complex subunit 3-like isoform X2 n=1 Tax=Ostrea edulis TaxID=37623 RepID=UPI0020946149|nr:conserved oligomeric Golgi complex subunit 3-like isoform X2 [Ostrea edulis]